MIRGRLKSIKPLRVAVRAIKEPIASRLQDVWLLAGKERSSGQPLSLMFAGRQDSRNYIAAQVYGDSWSTLEHTRMWKRRLLERARCANGGHDLAVLQLEPGRLPHGNGAATFQIPCWVGGEKDLVAAEEFARRSAHIKSDIRRIRKNRLDYRVTREAEEFHRFYHSMYLPHVQRVFGDRAFVMSYQDMQAAIAHCELFLVTQGGEDIAGGILVYDGSDCVQGWSLGVKDGDDRWVRAGALAAFECLQTGYLVQKGFRTLGRGASRAFLNDGALRFKKNRGMVITGYNGQSFTLVASRPQAGVWAFLQHNPFVYVQAGKLKGALFMTGEPSAAATAHMFHEWYVPGLECLTLFCLDEEQAKPVIRARFRINSRGELDAAESEASSIA